MDALELVLTLARRRVMLWREGEKIRWRGAGNLDPSLRDEVMRRRDEVHALLDNQVLEHVLAAQADTLFAAEEKGAASGGYDELLSDYERGLELYAWLSEWQRDAVAA